MKWAGGKGKLVPELLARLPKTYGRYYEPFVGGGALFFALAPARAVIADVNPDLVNLYRMVATEVGDVINDLRTHEVRHRDRSREAYEHVRRAWNSTFTAWNPIARAAAFLYLNRTCFNGLWRVNAKGHFNVPIGSYTNPRICDPEGLRAAAAVLAKAEIRQGDYHATVADAERGDLVYFDPPYDGTFTGYAAGGFDDFAQMALADRVRALAARGVTCLVSNSDTPFIRQIYRGAQVHELDVARGIRAKDSKATAPEVIIVAPGKPAKRSRKPSPRQLALPATGDEYLEELLQRR